MDSANFAIPSLEYVAQQLWRFELEELHFHTGSEPSASLFLSRQHGLREAYPIYFIPLNK